MRIDPTGYTDRDDRIMAVVMDDIHTDILKQGTFDHELLSWAYRHEDGTYTIHYSYNSISDVGMTEPILVENPMIVFANTKPTVAKILEAIKRSGV